MIEILKLEFENIGLFTDRQSISFQDKNKLIQVIAERSDYNGSSGSGKSTIFHAIDYAFGINQIPATALQSRKTKDGISVKIDILWDGSPVTIQRSKKQGLIVTGINPGTRTEFSVSGNVEQAEEKIDEIIGLPREVFKKMIHKSQKEGGFFLNLTPSESYKFLVKALKLESWLTKENNASELISKIQSEIQIKESKLLAKADVLEKLKNSLEQSVFQLNSLSAPEKRSLKDIDSIKKSKESAEALFKQEIFDANSKKPEKPGLHRAQIEDLENLKLTLKYEERSLINDLQSEESEFKKLLFDKQSIPKTLSLLSSKKKEKTQEILLIKTKINQASKHECPTCSQEWTSPSVYEYVESLKKEAVDLASVVNKTSNEINNLNEKLVSYENIEDKAVSIQNKIKEVQKEYFEKINRIDLQIKEKNKEINALNQSLNDKYQSEMNSWHEESARITSFYKDKISKIDSELSEAVYFKKLVESEKEMYESQKNILTSNFERAKMDHESSVNEVLKLELELSEMKYKLEVAKETKMVIKSFLNKTFQETLDQIGIEATLKLSRIPNASTSTVRFESFKEVKGKIKEEVTAFISINGDEDVNIKTLSGGERSSIDGAVDLSVYKVIEDRSGIGTNWLVLDEPFEGLDTQSRLDYIELLKESNDKKILIVDHTNEVKELAEDTIKVIRENDRSFIQ